MPTAGAEQLNGERRWSFQQIVPEQLDVPRQKRKTTTKNLDLNLTSYITINSKMDHGFKCKIKNFQGKSIGEHLQDVRRGEAFLDMMSKA